MPHPTTTEPLAVAGGTPAFAGPWPPDYPGASFIGEEERREVLEVLERRSLFRFYGPETPDKVATLEREFAAKIGTSWALGLTSGTAALKVGLAALAIGPADEVIVPAITFIASAGAVLSHRAYCVFAECDDSLGLDPVDVARKITPRTRAIMPVHLGGVACDLAPLLAVAKEHGIPIIEDCAQSAGASYHGRRIGSWGGVGAFSFQTQKIITAGEGGLITTSDAAMYERAFRYHDHGGYRFGREGVRVSGSTAAAGEEEAAPPAAQLAACVGEVYRMGELAGAVALAQVRKLDGILARARRNKRRLLDGLAGLRGWRFRTVPDAAGDAGTRLHLLLDDPSQVNSFCRAMRAEGIPIARVYDGLPVYAADQILHRRPSWAADDAEAQRRPLVPQGDPYGSPVSYAMGMCPRSEALLTRALVLAISPLFTDAQIDATITAFRKVCGALL
ncbi:MAG: DegT/DnrJ/EryC1/StrS family aminotransferase [Chloroflexota bacterium]